MPDVPRISDLINDLADPDWHVRLSAIWLLVDAREAGIPALPSLKKLLDHEDNQLLRLGAAVAVTQIAPHKADDVLPLLLAELHDDNFLHRETASKFIGNLGQRATVALPALIVLLEDEDEDVTVRCSASEAVGRISGDWSQAVEVGLSLIHDADWLTRVVAQEHFGAMGIEAKAAVPRLRALLCVVEWDVRLDLEVVLADIEAL